MSQPQPSDQAVEGPDPGMVRAGAAAAARRRELDISQRSLAADGIINAGALIAFEKGRAWPRERTRRKLEDVLRWPPGTIARIRQGEPAVSEARVETRPSSGDEAALVAQAMVTAASSFDAAIEALPAVDDAEFGPRATKILADLRQLEAITAQAARISKVSPALIKALGAIRTRYDELMLRAARSPHATVGQRLYAARRSANLTIAETAQAADVSEDIVMRAEAEEPLPAAAIEAIESLIDQLA